MNDNYITKTEEIVRLLLNRGNKNVETIWNLTGDCYREEIHDIVAVMNDLATLALSQHEEAMQLKREHDELVELLNSNKQFRQYMQPPFFPNQNQ